MDLRNIFKNKKEKKPEEEKKKDIPWKPIVFAADAGGVFKVLTTLFLALAVIATVKLAMTSQDLRSRAGSSPAGMIFCLGRESCPDGHCAGDSWEECDDCPKGRARIVTEVKCGIYKRTECFHETETCPVDQSNP
ncbi:hypothetical protein COY33_01335 [candidate division WWE3 bacterium CG_4_10_14_0_2_um_filter_42_7]|uniref:Uncharacterized protein n=2 Tax=Katanobacteria TaxID=422282 RepID=A0A2H0XCF2_UNCKA|nr:MAG: hypothetical protein COT51_00535 [candidate division WWE3 bacterium CG08_land_8_20_14_0_20_41_15]PIZ43557.1 MAG: hypothetical protein COY33_01335 [candidate division WWE3 bacterium CG_4_10_14_0_2_um_filter_42_7]